MLWRKDGEEVYVDEKRVFLTFENTLVVLDVKKTDEGIYSCKARNELGDATKDIDVTVKYGR